MNNWAYSGGAPPWNDYQGQQHTDRQPSPSETLSARSVATLSGASSPRAQSRSPRFANPGSPGSQSHSAPTSRNVPVPYHQLRVWGVPTEGDTPEVAALREQYARTYADWDGQEPYPTPARFITPEASPKPHGGYLSPQTSYTGSASPQALSAAHSGSASPHAHPASHRGSASPQTYPTPRASCTPSASRSGSASPHAYATARSASYTPSARSSAYAADDELEAVSRRSTSYRGSASPYYASSTTYSGSASPSYSTSRASSASLTPEPEQHFQCPDCSGVFGSREVLNMHLGGLYHHGHCPAHH